MTIQQLVENKATLDYKELCSTLINIFCAGEIMNWESILPAQQQQEYFGGETLRLIAEHPILCKQKDIRPIALKRGSISQMLFFYVTLKEENLSKKNIQEVTKKFISGGDANRYIIWFFGNTKNTELKVVLSAREGKKIVLKTLPFAAEQPYYKTYNFILNEVSQQVNKLFVEPTDLWKALWKAFDISIVNRNFYNEIKAVFDSLIQIELPKAPQLFKTEEIKVQFAIRLIGRLIFCWFLKRKGIIKDDVLSSMAVNSSPFGGGTEGISYYHNLLEILFFDVFNTPDKERKAGLPKIIAHYPFLNGGLFEAQDNDFRDNLLLNISNDWFLKLFAKTLERYNFTVDENSSSNAEIAIDPEMLGRIFENLLAEQNPETGDSARKATGSFYTPREIVDYMVEQSISEYLKTSLSATEVIEPPLKQNLFGTVPNQQLQIPQVKKGIKSFSLANSAAAIEEFVHTQTLPASLEKYETELSNALATIKVLDPACGSGAFPIGILQKIVALKQQLHPKAKNYNLKLDTIQNSIYGVDIQPMAVELSRLRCWLSLVVDEEPTDIKALPNLEFKFVCADSLMEVGKIKQLNIGNSAEKIDELKNLRGDYFIANSKQKLALEKKFKQIQTSLNNNFLEWDGKSKLVENLASWKPFDNHKTDWFDAFWMFGVSDGFDVVIGNPPYGATLSTQIKKEYKNNYELKTTETAILFIERGFKLLSNKGVECYIVPKSFTFASNYEQTREFVLNNLFFIVDCGKAFENVKLEACVFGLTKHFATTSYNSLKLSNELQIEHLSYIEKSLVTKFGFIPNGLTKNEIILGNEIFDKSLLLHNIAKNSRGEFLQKEIKSEGQISVIGGKEINKYGIRSVKGFIDSVSLITEKSKIHSNSILAQNIVSHITQPYNQLKIIACIPNKEDYLIVDTINQITITNKNFSHFYIWCLLNSKLINWYSYLFILAKAIRTIHFDNSFTSRIPIKEISQEKQENFNLMVKYILMVKNSKNETSINPSVSNNLIAKSFEDIIDGMVLELYFEEEMKEKKLAIIDLVTAALAKTNSNTIEDSIYNFYSVISHPDSEIRNRILNFPIASPTILKPILQG